MGLSFIVQDYNGVILAAASFHWTGVFSPILIEELSLFNSLLNVLVDSLKQSTITNIHLQGFVTDINSLLSSFPQATLCYVAREANTPAHYLTKYASG
ncbi:hypothetical protein G4B88_002567 [Cannabis sativa]|uniref:RNase H type-1 domain-containing protein n=1 Tax=Cannabis sativa TaxID=3483 RepID=A0A7J6I7Y5_CANSA|nr:hypothetical protein G4B88_002567 [Cannabis sativa]